MFKLRLPDRLYGVSTVNILQSQKVPDFDKNATYYILWAKQLESLNNVIIGFKSHWIDVQKTSEHRLNRENRWWHWRKTSILRTWILWISMNSYHTRSWWKIYFQKERKSLFRAKSIQITICIQTGSHHLSKNGIKTKQRRFRWRLNHRTSA